MAGQGLMRAASTGNPGRDPLSKRAADLYETPPEATLALLRAERLPEYIWEPAAGRGAIVNVLREAGHTVYASDLIDYGIPAQQVAVDFLMEWRAPMFCDCIVTNPPFALVDSFVRRAIDLVPKVCMLLRLAYLESMGRDDILDRLARVHVFKRRLARMHRDGWEGPKASSTIAFAWFVWDREHQGPVALHRITWERLDADSRVVSAAEAGDGAARRTAHGP
jgi:hypothetical protein